MAKTQDPRHPPSDVDVDVFLRICGKHKSMCVCPTVAPLCAHAPYLALLKRHGSPNVIAERRHIPLATSNLQRAAWGNVSSAAQHSGPSYGNTLNAAATWHGKRAPTNQSEPLRHVSKQLRPRRRWRRRQRTETVTEIETEPEAWDLPVQSLRKLENFKVNYQSLLYGIYIGF